MKKHLLPIIALFVITVCRAQQPVLWGMTSSGVQGGVIFNYNSGIDTETVAHDFGNGTDGTSPTGSLIKATNNLLYGMTQGGGAANVNGGIVFSYNIFTGQETDLHDFDGSDTDGYGPVGSLLQANDSLLYGMAQEGGAYNGGIIFNYNISTGKEMDIYDFGFGSDAAYPTGSLLQVNDSLLYGMTPSGGLYGVGTLFSYNISTGTETILWNFGSDTDGYRPNGSLIRASDGLLYGMTAGGGGSADTGVLFSFNISADTEIVVHYFAGSADGSSPMGSLMQASNSLLYGMTEAGGFNDEGVIFSYNISTGKDSVLWNFGTGTDGYGPQGSLIQTSNGLLYGMTLLGGTISAGTIFSYDISTGQETDIHDFGNTNDGTLPQGDLLEDDAFPVQIDLQCNDRDQHSLYFLIQGMGYYRIDSVDTYPTKPVFLGADTLNSAGISINNNLDTADGEMTMYMCDLNAEYYYWNNTNWKDTHHTTGNPDALNPGGTNQYIFNLDPINGTIYRYDGTVNGTELVSHLPIDNFSIWDIATDMNGNFYILYGSLYKIIAYSPNGIPIDTFTLSSKIVGSNGGFAILGSKFYVASGYAPSSLLYRGVVTGNSVNFSVIDTIRGNFYIADMASCPNAAEQLAVFEVPDAPHFIIYPNPASNKAIIKMDNTNSIDIFNSIGQKIFTANTRGLKQYQLSLGGYTPGIYLVTATSPNELVTHTTLVVQ